MTLQQLAPYAQRIAWGAIAACAVVGGGAAAGLALLVTSPRRAR